MRSTKGDRIDPRDEAILREAERIVDSDAPALLAYREFILEVLRVLLVQQSVKRRIKLILTPEQTTAFEGKLYDQIAAVISKTYAEVGEVAELADDEAISLIRELLLDHDPAVIDRNRFRKVSLVKLQRKS
jgi:hypothetical protein